MHVRFKKFQPSWKILIFSDNHQELAKEVGSTDAVDFTNNAIKCKRSKAIDMSFYWLKYRESQGQFNIYCYPGVHNVGDYFTKLFSFATHISKRAVYLREDDAMENCLTLIKLFA